MSLLSRLAVQAARAYGILSSNPNNVPASYLVVAGGGGGGAASGGGGGAGGLLAATTTLSILNTYTVTVGAGGIAGTYSGTRAGGSGNNSVISGTGLTTITSIGGGGAQAGSSNPSPVAQSGGSGGGGGGGSTSNTGGAGTSGQGFAGGDGNALYGGGGGGGAGAVGSNAPSGNRNGGAGGIGATSSISGSSVYYAGGGGGGPELVGGGSGGAGGTGGGGTGNSSGGTANTGGGGGGGNNATSPFAGYAGGSGIVIISYTSATPKFVGGTLTTSGGNQIHTFTSSGTLSPITPITASYLVVAGGGGGGSNHAGGGGAGGYLESTTTLYSGATYVVTVGAGGAGGSSSNNGSSGTNSVLLGTGLTTVTSTGGGGGAATNGNAANGGSGGGAHRDRSTPGTGTVGQGNNGGGVSGSSGLIGGGGGGGSGSVGGNGSGANGGAGGSGTTSSISGSSVGRAGGGGGGSYNGTGGSASSGGGAGGNSAGGFAGTANTGGGGGGGDTGVDVGGSGGSGVVIISYAGSQAFNGGLVTSSGGNTIHTFTSTGALTPLTNNLNNSLRFRVSNNAYLQRTPTVVGNRTTWTYSAWVKRGALGNTQDIWHANGSSTTDNNYLNFTSDTLQFRIKNSNVVVSELITTQVFRDPSAWYHIVCVWDSTQATAANRARLYVNGNQITALSTATYPSQNTITNSYNNTVVHNIGTEWYNSTYSNYFDGYLTDINFIDGQALEPYYFGNNDANGVWKPILYKGTYGTNGFYLTFSDTSALTTSSNVGLGKDFSGNGNYWATNNISITAGATYDAMTDVPTNTSATVANYAVMSPIDFISANGTISSANLNWASSTNVCGNRATIGSTSGKWYWEAVGSSVTSGTVGGRFAFTGGDTTTVEQDKFGMYWHPNSGISRIVNGTDTNVTSAYTYTNGDVLALALDLDNNISYWYKNGALQYTYDFSAYSTIGTRVFFAYAWNGSSGTPSWVYNFGQRPFAYTPRTNHVSWNTFNLPTPTILKGSNNFGVLTYTGNGATSATRIDTNAVNFTPDFVWIKERSGTDYHNLFDINRVVSGDYKRIYSNDTTAEESSTYFGTTNLNGFVNGGFTTGSGGNTNTNGDTYVAWCWDANGSPVSNTSGSITSTVSVNTTAGFSVVTYTGTGTAATVGHGLGVAPKMLIVKNRVQGTYGNWTVWQTTLTGSQYLELNSTTAVSTNNNRWNGTVPTSTVFSVGTDSFGNTNKSGDTYVAYCWAEIAGFSRFGSYTGNGSADGSFIYTGFRPAFIMFKRTNDVSDWNILDTTRSPYNTSITRLFANSSNAENSSAGNYDIDILSNGFKQRNTNASTSSNSNLNGSTYIYMAFAENPFKNANAR